MATPEELERATGHPARDRALRRGPHERRGLAPRLMLTPVVVFTSAAVLTLLNGCAAAPREAPAPARATENERACARVVLEGAQAAVIETGAELRHAWASAGTRGPLALDVDGERTSIAIDASDCGALIALLEERRVLAHEGHAGALAFLMDQRAAVQARLDAAVAAEDAFTRERGTAEARDARTTALAARLERARGAERERLVEQQLALERDRIEATHLARSAANERALLVALDARLAQATAPVPPFAPEQCRPGACAE